MPTGGEVKFDIRNDAPTLTGAKVTFTIDIIFPENQLVLPNGKVVWRKNCFVNGMSANAVLLIQVWHVMVSNSILNGFVHWYLLEMLVWSLTRQSVNPSVN